MMFKRRDLFLYLPATSIIRSTAVAEGYGQRTNVISDDSISHVHTIDIVGAHFSSVRTNASALKEIAQ